MAFDKDELRQLEELRSMIALDTRSIVYQELTPVKTKLDRLIRTESEDVSAAY